jgi:hypothetical protein
MHRHSIGHRAIAASHCISQPVTKPEGDQAAARAATIRPL